MGRSACSPHLPLRRQPREAAQCWSVVGAHRSISGASSQAPLTKHALEARQSAAEEATHWPSTDEHRPIKRQSSLHAAGTVDPQPAASRTTAREAVAVETLQRCASVVGLLSLIQYMAPRKDGHSFKRVNYAASESKEQVPSKVARCTGSHHADQGSRSARFTGAGVRTPSRLSKVEVATRSDHAARGWAVLSGRGFLGATLD